MRGEGAGTGDADTMTDAAATWEGLFKVVVKVSDVTVRTTTDINALTWTYTDAQNTSDNGTPADDIVFYLTNFRVANGITYETDSQTINVYKE